ncbi:MAG: iron-containing alcohol dehydrogenase [Magnetococcales bacterium]|nr:iron-containing alcohol dehydrogenase [Magnetococcales bacterium]
MLNFDFYNPTNIIFGKGQVAQLSNLVPKGARILITYGGNSAKSSGTLKEVQDALKDYEVMLFGGIEPNPRFETLIKAVEVIKNNNLDFILAVGGGSVIDGTKFIAAAYYADGDPWGIVASFGQSVRKALPYGAILTLPATGSEMNNGGVITRASDNTKLPMMNRLLYPRFSILDPTKSYTLPTKQLANGVVDAYVHVIEQYLTYPVNAHVQDRFSEGILQTLIEIGPAVINNPKDYELQANLMWCATMALNGLIGAGVPHDWATHMLGHEITALHGLDHAQTLAIVLPSMLQHRKKRKRDKLLQYARRVWNINHEDEEKTIDEAIEKTRNFFTSLGVKTSLSEYQLGPEIIEPILTQLEEHHMTKLGEHNDVTPDVCRKILQLSM